MRNARIASLAFVFLAGALAAYGSTESKIEDQLHSLRSVAADKRPEETAKIAAEIRTLDGGKTKLQFADTLAHMATEGDAGMPTLQAVTDALAEALTQFAVPQKGDNIPDPYSQLAKLVHYEGTTTNFADPLYQKALKKYVDEDAKVAKADFTLKDLKGKSYALAALRGKIVLVNFWATWCGPCRVEMPDLDLIYTHFQSQGLVVLSITDEQPFKVSQVIGPSNYHPPVLLDSDGKVHKQFHVEGIPKTYVFNRDGKLIGVAVDQRTRKQFLTMLSKTDLHP
jgi:peroxiredoxin